MAKSSTERQINVNQEKTRKAIQKKVESQYKLGKEFYAQPYGPGVVPEKKWKQAKKDGSAEGVEDYV
jgi:hypothetical protein